MANATIFFIITVVDRPAPTRPHSRKERALMSVQPALVVETIEATEVLEGTAPQARPAAASAWSGSTGPARSSSPSARSRCSCRSTSRSRWRSRRRRRRWTATRSRCPRRSASTDSSTAWELTNFPLAFMITVLVTAGDRRRHDPARGRGLLRHRPQLGPQALPLVVLLPADGDVHPVPGAGAAADPADRARRTRQPGRASRSCTSCSS